jgi:hypothetical protein
VAFPVLLSKTEALARLADGDPLEVRFEKRPNDGTTIVVNLPRQEILAMIQRVQIAGESGPEGQKLNFGIYLEGQCSAGYGCLFLPTKPGFALSEEQLKQSLQRGHGGDIFSGNAQHDQSGIC